MAFYFFAGIFLLLIILIVRKVLNPILERLQKRMDHGVNPGDKVYCNCGWSGYEIDLIIGDSVFYDDVNNEFEHQYYKKCPKCEKETVSKFTILK